MLPGITTKVVKIIKRNHKQGHKIKAACLTLWTDIVSSIINDRQVFLEPSIDYHEDGDKDDKDDEQDGQDNKVGNLK